MDYSRLQQIGCGWLLFCSLTTPAIAAPAVTETILREPVFRGEAHVYTSGPENAPNVVLVHGIGDKGARDWTGLTSMLAPDFHVISFDLPGFGRSSKGNEQYTPKNYAAFIHYVVQQRVTKRPFFLVGHSMGGAVALRYAALYPQDVQALVLADVPGILNHLAYSRYLGHLGIDHFVPKIYRAQNDHLSNLMSTIAGKLEWAKLAPQILLLTPRFRQKFLSADPARIAGLALVLEDFSADLERVRIPTLVLWGGRDELAPLRNGRVLSANLPQAQLKVFASSGHTPMDDVPELFNRRVTEFLQDPKLERRNDILDRSMNWPETTRTGNCNGQRGMVFEGDYQRLTISHCRDVLVHSARVRELRIAEATVSIEDSLIGGSEGGLHVDDARVTITSSVIEGRVAITALAAHLDIAGSRIIGKDAALEAPRTSEILFSLTRVQSPRFQGNLHERRIVTPETTL